MLKKFILWGKYCEDVLEKRTPFRQTHLDNLRSLQESGQVFTIGPTTDLTKVFGIYIAADLESAKKLVESDIYWQNQIWTEYELFEWIQAL
jgi:uncharacterized protein